MTTQEEAQLAPLESRRAELNSEISTKRGQINSLETRRDSVIEEIQGLSRELGTKEGAIRTYEAANSVLAKSLKKDVALLQTTKSILESEVLKLEQLFDAKTNEINTLLEIESGISQNIENINQAYSALNSALQRIENITNLFEDSVTKAERKIKDFGDKVFETYQKEVAMLVDEKTRINIKELSVNARESALKRQENK